MGTARILVLRFSAMGDVAMVVPVVRSLTSAYPETIVAIVTRPKFAALFHGIPGVEVIGADVDRNYRGLPGLWKLFRKLIAMHPDRVIDLHDHLRTRFLCIFFNFAGFPVTVFDKGRTEKRLATGNQREHHRDQLAHTTERYRLAFQNAGYDFNLLSGPHVQPRDLDTITTKLDLTAAFQERIIRVGIAPFSAHATKTWPLENFIRLMELFRHRQEVRFFLFGGGAKEKQLLDQLEESGRIANLAGRLNLTEELTFMSSLHTMVCVDSSNMHLAGLAGIPVVSIWGGTDPVTGFGPAPHPQTKVLSVPVQELPCRPCSVYGKEICPRGDFACLKGITPEQVAESVSAVIG
ncbi:MAG: glycosyltransferase family 9 protein [Bacteroidota bacterium]